MTIDGIEYTIFYSIFASGKVAPTYADIEWNDDKGYHKVRLTYAGQQSELNEALANYCAVLAQLNKDVWMDFMAYYVADTFKRMDIETVTKKKIEDVFKGAEKVIKALYSKEDADALLKEIGGEIKEDLKASLVNKFKRCIKNDIPNGDKIVKAAELYKTAKEHFEDFQEFSSPSSKKKNEEKAVKAFSKFEKVYGELAKAIDSI